MSIKGRTCTGGAIGTGHGCTALIIATLADRHPKQPGSEAFLEAASQGPDETDDAPPTS